MATYVRPAEINIPVIDISATFSDDAAARAAVAKEIDRTCRATGFFYIRGHGMSAKLIEDQFAQARAFFDRPMHEKMTCESKLSASLAGFEAAGLQALDPDNPPDLKEGFSIGIERGPEHPLVKAGIRGLGSNKWPVGDDLFRRTTESYLSAALDLGTHVMTLVALALKLPDSFFEPYFTDPQIKLRMLHYPPHPLGAAANQLGCGSHTDWGAITLLAQDSCGGLEVQIASGEWVVAEPVEDTFVVNIGDLLARWSNDIYKSTPHRVLNNISGRDRYSLAFFYNPDYTARIECLPGCSDGEPLYGPCTAGEHVQQMYFRSRPELARGMAKA